VAGLRYAVVDVFTETPLQGNPVAVFTDARAVPEPMLQPLARELNLSETVYVLPKEADGHVRVRIFTPAVELPFAGHPVLGTAFLLGAPLQLDEIRLETGAGTVPVRLEREEARIRYGAMVQPFPRVEPVADPEALLAALGVERSELPLEVYDNGVRHAFVALGSPEQVAAVAPDVQALRRFEGGVSCFAGAGARWKTRMFAPAMGVAEDPATGSAAGPLAVHLVRHGLVEPGARIEISQGGEVGRPSTLYATADGERVEVGGSAVVVARGEFRL
jgi:trans-2,3-dihydro-3-hydroxyanthranilate isomerase